MSAEYEELKQELKVSRTKLEGTVKILRDVTNQTIAELESNDRQFSLRMENYIHLKLDSYIIHYFLRRELC